MKDIKTPEELLMHCLEDLYSAEVQITEALPKMMKAASNSKLKQGFEKHLAQTEEQIKRLDEAMSLLEMNPDKRISCKGMKGILEEGDEALETVKGDELKDSAIISGSAKVEHYEMSGYKDAILLANKLKMDEVVKLLQQTLDEETKMAEELEAMGEKM